MPSSRWTIPNILSAMRLVGTLAGLLALPLLGAIACAQEPTPRGPDGPRRPTVPCTVTRVVDGDTIHCDGLGRVRLIGIDTPELAQRPHGERVARTLAGLLSSARTVTLEYDVERRDRYGRRLAYLWADGVLVNWWLVHEGLAVVTTYPPNVQYVEAFTAAQRAARERRAGLWSRGGFDCLPADHRRGRCDG